jgi:hypothetical protein
MKKIFPYIIVLLLVIIAVILFMNSRRAMETPVVDTTGQVSDTPTSTVTTTPIKPTDNPAVAVAGMAKYTDSSLGYSFWYPTNWTVTATAIPTNGGNIQDATTVAMLSVGPKGGDTEISIQEVKSTTRTVTDTGGAGPIGPITYFFDTTSHLWMTKSSIADGVTSITKPADITRNSMGGLHLFGGTSRFDSNIIPLTANNFVIIKDTGVHNATALAKTVVAIDPSVATPVSAKEQVAVIQAEKTEYMK